jgi:hypothetical protein
MTHFGLKVEGEEEKMTKHLEITQKVYGLCEKWNKCLRYL